MKIMIQRRLTVSLILTGVILTPSPGRVWSQAPQPAKAPAVPAAPAKPADPGWPRVYTKGEQKLEVHQPQVDSWKDYGPIDFRCALGVQTKKDAKLQYGVAEVHADTKVDQAARTVLLLNPKVVVRFTRVKGDEGLRLESIAEDLIPNLNLMTVSLDRVLAYLDAEQAVQREIKVSLEPPKIYHSSTPAILVMFMGKPRFKPAPSTNLMFATNTNWSIFMDPAKKEYYLLNGEQWLTSTEPTSTAWKAAAKPPEGLSKLPDNESWKEVKAALPGKMLPTTPAVFVTKEPAELIVTKGEPEFSPIKGTSLMAVANTDKPLVYEPTAKQYYLLAAGRWFSAPALTGPWTAATTTLPEEFKKLPADDPAGDLLASVPGTAEAEDALLLASIPHKATINPKEAKLEVQYGGEPKFEPIESIGVNYAVNTYEDVFQIGNRYYCCKNGVWFESPTPKGVWVVCVNVPPALYNIPPDHPKHNVTYVYVYESTPEQVEVGYTSGYEGQYVANGVLMFGAGLLTGALIDDDDDDHDHDDYYDDYYDYHDDYHHSYGHGAVYSSHYGGYHYGSPYYGPGGGVGYSGYYNHNTGSYARGAYATTGVAAVGAVGGYNAWTGNYGARAGGSNIYGDSWGRTVVGDDDDWARAGHRTTDNGTVGWAESSEGGKVVGAAGDDNHGFAGKTRDDDIYAGANGEVYKREEGEDWQKYDDGDWEDVNNERNSKSNQERSAKTNQERLSEAGKGVTDKRPSNTNGGASAATRPSNTTGGASAATRPSDRTPTQIKADRERETRAATANRAATQPASPRGGSAGSAQNRPGASNMDRQAQARDYGNSRANQTASRPSSSTRPATRPSTPSRPTPSRTAPSRSAPSRSAPSRSAPSRSGGGGGSRGGGGGSRGGGGGGRR